MSQTVNGAPTNYALDLNAGLTQVLAGGNNTYLYGVGRIGEQQPGGMAYHLPDALGSVRQLADTTGTVTLARSYEPFGNTLASVGTGNTVFQFTGEQRDSYIKLLYLRARWLDTTTGRFITRDTWAGDDNAPLTLNGWNYGLSNPVYYIDPSGRNPICLLALADGPAPMGDAICLFALAATGLTALFYATTPPPTLNSGSNYFTHEEFDFPPLVFPPPERQPLRPLVFPLPQERSTGRLVFPLPTDWKYRCNILIYLLDSGLRVPPYTPPAQLPDELQRLVRSYQLDTTSGGGDQPSVVMENHHLLPKQFRDRFERAGLDIEDYTVDLPRGFHKDIHGRGGSEAWINSWNQQWDRFFDRNSSPSADKILQQLKIMKEEFGIP